MDSPHAIPGMARRHPLPFSIRATLSLALLLALPVPAAEPATATNLDPDAERCVRLVLAIGEHDETMVGAFYGPPQWREDAKVGTCRMGNDSKTSVGDRCHRSHDIRNLFICAGSSLVTSGRGQPTMTIPALAFRAGERMAGFAKRGEI
jgi:choline dehydrogenase-like flavoprotein